MNSEEERARSTPRLVLCHILRLGSMRLNSTCKYNKRILKNNHTLDQD